MEQHKTFVPLFIVMLCFSIFLSTAAIPTSRPAGSLLPMMAGNSAQELYVKDLVDKKVDDREMLEVEEQYVQRRMDIESNLDYPGTGANNHHDPKTPGRA